MGMLFPKWKPRRFHHEPIYSSERSERLARLEQRARRELGMTPGNSDRYANHSMGFTTRPVSFATDRQLRHRATRGVLSSGFGLAVVVLLLLVLLLLAIL